MKAGVLYSGGKDSSLAAMMLGTHYEVELNVFVFDPSRQVPSVDAAAQSLGFPIKKRIFKEGLLNEMVDLVKSCGYPNDAINRAHRIAVETLASEYPVVGDGTRFNDRVPRFSRAEVQSLLNRTGCSYVRPLLGYVKPEVDRLVDRFFIVQYGESGTINNGDYETGIREALIARGINPTSLFPVHHEQSLVIGKKQYPATGE
jgi:predicted subunit of tRNA(5-methylaminomethyl-2-thiouridylate) methyltransferase